MNLNGVIRVRAILEDRMNSLVSSVAFKASYPLLHENVLKGAYARFSHVSYFDRVPAKLP